MQGAAAQLAAQRVHVAARVRDVQQRGRGRHRGRAHALRVAPAGQARAVLGAQSE